MKKEINSAIAHQQYRQCVVLVKQQALLFLRLGRVLKDIKDHELYKDMGEGGFDTFQQFLNNPEIGLKPSTAYLYIRIYEYYQLELHMGEEEIIKTPINRLMTLMPHLKKMKDKDAKKLVEDTQDLTNYDFKEEMAERELVVQKPSVYLHSECNKYRIEYKEDQICQCDGEFHLTNKSLIE